MRTILFMGQSNAIGRADGSLVTGPLVTAWDNSNDRDDLTQLGSSWIAPALGSAPLVAGKPSPAIAAAHYLAQALDEPVRVILVAKGATPIVDWIDQTGTTGPMYARMIAVLQEASVASVDAFLWLQGENDIGALAAYPARFAALLDELQDDGIIGAETPVIAGEISNRVSSAFNTMLRSVAAASSRMAVARIGNYSMIDGDDYHFSGDAIGPIGAKYARAASTLAGPWFTESNMTDPILIEDLPNASPLTRDHVAPVMLNGTAQHVRIDELAAFVHRSSPAWEPISRVTASSAASVTFTDLGDYQALRLTARIKPAIDTSAAMLRVSSDNGASYDAGSTDYAWQVLRAQGTSATATEDPDVDFIVLTLSGAVGSGSGVQSDVVMTGWGSSQQMFALIQSMQVAASGAVATGTVAAVHNQTVALNAFQIMMSSGDIAEGHFVLEGLRAA